jgi:hypothetical protein
MQPLTPIETAHLFAPLHRELIALLRELEPADWDRPTIAGRWRIKEVVGHLLDDDLRKLSGGRDAHRASIRPSSDGYGDIVAFINALNASGVSYAERLSPRVLVDLLDVTGAWVADFVMSLEPHAVASISVLWAGERQSENWMDIGREYTERWHHQMQIRDAMHVPLLLQSQWLDPVLDLSVRAFPPAYERVDAAVGTAVTFEVDGGYGSWSIVREPDAWVVMRGRAERSAATVRADADAAWRLLYHALPADRARTALAISGDAALVEPLLRARAVMV